MGEVADLFVGFLAIHLADRARIWRCFKQIGRSRTNVAVFGNCPRVCRVALLFDADSRGFRPRFGQGENFHTVSDSAIDTFAWKFGARRFGCE